MTYFKKYKWFRRLLGGKWYLYQDYKTLEYFWYHNEKTNTKTTLLQFEEYERPKRNE